MTYLAVAVAAALSFTTGGIFMKHADGLDAPGPVAAVFALFLVGATLNILLVHWKGDLGSAYVIVVGLEAVLAFAFGVALFGESATPARLLAISLIVSGITLLERSPT